MPSLIPGYEYDIFVSYRHNDNLPWYDHGRQRNPPYDYEAQSGPGWVSEFVKKLREELAATIKEPVSVYFDENPHDGLLEIHDVDRSLAGKLQCLIFIPVLSQTYCDERSYAWKHELLPFCARAKTDPFGLNIKLANGNVSSRILPLRLHNLEPADQLLFEKQTGSPLRCIDFIFKAPGVHRPLRFTEEQPQANLNKTFYRDQLNKVANAIKDIVTALRDDGAAIVPGDRHAAVRAAADGKSIAVLPFVNMSNDPEQEYFSDGISEEIINLLVQLPDLKVAGRTSAFSFKKKNKDIRFIGEKLNVNTILEGSVRRSGTRIRITAQLIEASTGFHLWSQKFDRELNDVFRIQDEIASAIVDQLQISLSGRHAEPKERVQTQNVEAYQLYLKGMAFFYKRGLDMFEGLRCFEAALKLDPDYALALVGVADTYTMLCFHSYLPPEEGWPKASEAAGRALELGPDMA